MRKMRKIGLVAALCLLSGCVHVRNPRYIVPSRCIAINIRSFTQPCQQHADGKIVCNGVVITASCLAKLPEPTGRDRQYGEVENGDLR
jgi:hypothetical protein